MKDGTAELRPVTAGVTYEDVTVIEKGLSAGEQVVTDGQMRLCPDQVEIKSSGQNSNSQKESSKPQILQKIK